MCRLAMRLMALTTRANAIVGAFHDRMPIILEDERAKKWVEAGEMSEARLSAFRKPYPAEDTQEWAASSTVNKPANESPMCVVPLTANE